MRLRTGFFSVLDPQKIPLEKYGGLEKDVAREVAILCRMIIACYHYRDDSQSVQAMRVRKLAW